MSLLVSAELLSTDSVVVNLLMMRWVLEHFFLKLQPEACKSVDLFQETGCVLGNCALDGRLVSIFNKNVVL